MEYRIDHGLELLERSPASFEALLAGLSEAWLHVTEGPDTWSPWEVMAHMTDLERTDWLPRVKILLEHGEGRPFDPVDRTAFRTRLAGRSVSSLLEEFAQLRSDNLTTLRDLRLDEDRLQLPGVHPALGPVTLSQLLAAWVVHDLTHIAQIVRVIAKQYAAAVGPWREYLGVLNR
jgi:hypothetical protein